MKHLVVLSGGMDSTVALASVLQYAKPDNVETVTFNYGSKHNHQENLAAKSVAIHFGVNNTLIELPFVNQLFKSDLLQSGGDIPEGHYADPSMKRTVVPFRNGIMLAIAGGLAESIDASTLILGNHVGDHAVYPDCRSSFSKPFGEALESGTYNKIKLLTPFGSMTKTEIAALGDRLGTPFHLTYSCYKGGDTHCGKCGTCFERKEAFRDAGIKDPTAYLE